MTNSNERFFTKDDQGTWWRVNEDGRWHGPCSDLADAAELREIWLINNAGGAADFAADNFAFAGR